MRIIEDFLPDYIVNTFENVVVALIIATIAVTGIYYELFIPSLIQIIVLSMIIKYKKLKSDTDGAVNSSIQLKAAKSDAEKKLNKHVYYEEYRVLRHIKNYVTFSIILISISIFFVWYFPSETEKNKTSLNIKDNQLLIDKIESLKMDINSLKDSLTFNKNVMKTIIIAKQKLDSKNKLSK